MADMLVKNRPLRVGETLTITGIPKTNVQRFVVNISSGVDHALHMSVQFHGAVIYNSYQGGVWGDEVRHGGFPFKYDKLFKFTISLTLEEFLVVLSDGSEIHFPNRLGASEYKDFSFDEGVLIRSFEIN
ncbi:beta-galactoside-binding lectin [Gadus morhua]|uniref:Galectin n=1 Tax=Gadus morhua TaxID=8049 RepID=A0A8C5ABR2_GADMO|nr:beta-galactoside-binding lectin-like [Gadus morhua]